MYISGTKNYLWLTSFKMFINERVDSHNADLLYKHESSEHRRESDTLGAFDAESELMHWGVPRTLASDVAMRNIRP